MAASLLKAGIAVMLAAVAGAASAQTPDRNRLPINIEVKGPTSFDTQNGVLNFSDITITQGDIRITAQRAVATGVDFEDSRWEFSGTVRIKTVEAQLASDTARVRFSKGEIQSASITGGPATFEQKRDDKLAQGRANRIDYDLGRGAVEFAGDAWLSDGRNEVAGATLVYSTASGNVKSNEPVKFTIQPGETSAQPPAPAPAQPPAPQPVP